MLHEGSQVFVAESLTWIIWIALAWHMLQIRKRYNWMGMRASCNATGQAFCTSCPANTYNPSIGSDTMSCYPCKSGFEAKVGSPICCPRGTYVLIATTGASCQPCPRGYFPDTSSFTGCTACAAGTTADPYDYECRNCPSGYYSKGGSECLSCPSGKFSLEGNATCTDCPTDSFSNEGSAQCKSCTLWQLELSNCLTNSCWRHDSYISSLENHCPAIFSGSTETCPANGECSFEKGYQKCFARHWWRASFWGLKKYAI